MFALGKLNFVETASALSILGFIFNVLLSLITAVKKVILGARLRNDTIEIEITNR